MKTYIQIPSGINYLSENLSDLPHNVIFGKSIVGCGGTTIAIRNQENYIITVPYVSLVQNKVSQNNNLLGVYGKTSDKEILNYILSNQTHKIITTYDSLCRVVQLLNNQNIDIKNYRLLIDEYHLLFTNYSFRHDAVRCVLDNYTKFKSYCFMTATLLEDEFILKELNHIPIVEAEWTNVKTVTVNSVKCIGSVVPTISNVIIKFLNGTLEGNAYFFVNSVEFIKETVKLLNLNDDNTRGIWSKYNKTNPGIKLSSTTDSPKKINFLTSTCFEGVDLYDENAKIYIVSDKSKSHTLVDISTSFQQIACRVRNTKYGDNITHIYTSTRYDIELTYNEFKKETEKGIKEAKDLLQEFSTLSEKARNSIKSVDQPYIFKKNSDFMYDENLVKIDLYNYKVTKCLYKLRVNLHDSYKTNGFDVKEYKSLIKNDFKVTNVFKEVVIECKKQDEDYLKWAFSKYPFLEIAIIHLGFDKMEELDYNKSHIERYASKYFSVSEINKISLQLDTYYELAIGVFVSNNRIKEILDEIYKTLDIIKTAKASDINQYKHVKVKQKWIKGKAILGYVIIK